MVNEIKKSYNNRFCLIRKIIRLLMYCGFFDFLSDKKYVTLMYWARLNEFLDLNNVKSFNEKMQWLKVNDHNDYYTSLVDKYQVKEIIREKIGKKYLFPTIGVYERFDDIDFDSLPNRFVIKCTHDSGGLVICKDKKRLDISKAKRKICKCMKYNYYWHGREWPYKNVRPRIIIEPYVESGGGQLNDYKIFCFNGIPKFIEVDYDRFTSHKRNFYSLSWEYLPFTTLYPTDPNHIIEKPECFDEMIALAKEMNKIAENPAFLRVDLYVVDNKPFFGEFTFYHGSGCEVFNPREWDLKTGEMIEI